jgi:hypothetical protein
MKHLITGLLLCSVTVVLAQQSESRSVGSFKGVKVSEAIDVYLKKGDKESVKVEVTGVDLEDVLTEVSGEFLKVHMASGNYKNSNVKVYVTYVELTKLSASSAANIYSEGTIRGRQMSISSSSAATVDVALETESLTVSASSAADVELRGKGKSITVDASSAGEIDADDFEAEEANAEASSAGTVKLNATQSLDAHASSGGTIRYRGNPMKTNTNASSGGSVKKMG